MKHFRLGMLEVNDINSKWLQAKIKMHLPTHAGQIYLMINIRVYNMSYVRF